MELADVGGGDIEAVDVGAGDAPPGELSSFPVAGVTQALAFCFQQDDLVDFWRAPLTQDQSGWRGPAKLIQIGPPHLAAPYRCCC